MLSFFKNKFLSEKSSSTLETSNHRFDTLISTHPQSNATFTFEQGNIAYLLERKRRKSLGLYVGANGVTVRVPLRVSQKVIDGFLQDKSSWLFEKIKEQKNKKEEQQEQQIVWADGGKLPYLGGQLEMRLISGQTSISFDAERVRLNIGEALFLNKIRKNKTLTLKEFIRQQVEGWLKEQALIHFQKRVKYYSSMMEVSPQRIALTSAKTRWGSANSKGVIRLHWQLICFSERLIDYVVVHELAHLKEMNHSAQFWSHVEAIMPDYKQRKAALRNKPIF